MKNNIKKLCVGDIVKLSELGVKRVAQIVKVECENKKVCRRLFEMGLTNGVVAEVKKIAPLGDPVSLEIRGYQICLRKSELKNVVARVLK